MARKDPSSSTRTLACIRGLFDGDESAVLALAPGRRAYVHIARGSIVVDGAALATGDAAMLTDVREITR